MIQASCKTLCSTTTLPVHPPQRTQPRRPQAFWTALAAACAALCAPPAQAQTSEASLPAVQVPASRQLASELLQLDQTTETGSRLGLTARELPASVTLIDRNTIDQRAALNTQDMLQNIAGITAHDAPGNIGVSYRGFGSGSLTQMFNGIHAQYTIAARPVDSWIYDRVEAIGGPSSFLFGAGSVGGSINYITKLPERHALSEAQLRLGSFGRKQLSVGINRALAGQDTTTAASANRHYWRLDLNHQAGGKWSDGTDSRSTQLATSLLSDLGAGMSHTLAYEFQDEKVDRPYWGTPARVSDDGVMSVDPGLRRRNFNSADGVYSQRVHWLRSISEWRASDRLQWKNTLYLYDALRDYRNVETYLYAPDQYHIERSAALLQRHDQRLVGNRFEGQYQGSLAGRRSDWAFGLDISQNRQTRFPNSLAGTVSTVDPYDFETEHFFDISGMSPGFRPDRQNQVTTTALSVENRTALHADWQLITALRHEQIRMNLTNHRAITPANPAHYARTYQPTTGRVGLVWRITPQANAYVQYATAADPPSGSLTSSSFTSVRENTALTTGRQTEIGSKFDFWQGKGSATLAAYQISRKNIATQDLDNAQKTLLVGEQSSRGLEVNIGVQATAQWAVQAQFSHVRARYEQFVQSGVSLAGRTPTNTPANVASLWLSYAATPALQWSLGVRHVGSVYADAHNTQRWPAYTLLDLGMGYRINRQLSVNARLRNATDRIYASNVSRMAYLGAPRSLDVALRWSY